MYIGMTYCFAPEDRAQMKQIDELATLRRREMTEAEMTLADGNYRLAWHDRMRSERSSKADLMILEAIASEMTTRAQCRAEAAGSGTGEAERKEALALATAICQRLDRFHDNLRRDIGDWERDHPAIIPRSSRDHPRNRTRPWDR